MMLSNDQSLVYEGFVWGHNPVSLREQPLIDPTSWAGAVQHEIVSFGVEVALNTPREPAAEYLAAAVVMMVKDEADIIGENLLWLYHCGLRRYIIDDNGSTDATASIIERFRRAHRDVELLVLKDPIVRYMQAQKTTGMHRLALSIWPDLRWVIPTDADEFLIAERGLGVLDEFDSQVDAISIPKVVHFKQRGSASARLSTMEQMDYRSRLFYVPPKIILKSNVLAMISQGNHKVHFADDRPAIYAGGLGHGLYYREFPTRSFEHLLRKIRNGGPANLAAEKYLGHDVGSAHWTRYYDMLLSGGEEYIFEIYNREWLRGGTDGYIKDPFAVDASVLL